MYYYEYEYVVCRCRECITLLLLRMTEHRSDGNEAFMYNLYTSPPHFCLFASQLFLSSHLFSAARNSFDTTIMLPLYVDCRFMMCWDAE